MVMAPPNAPAGGPPNDPPRGLLDELAEVGRKLRARYGTEYEWDVIGRAPGRRTIRLSLPTPPSPPPDPPTPQEGSNRETILEALAELPDPPTQRELFLKAFGGIGTGAQRRSLERLVRDRLVVELDTNPKRYDLA